MYKSKKHRKRTNKQFSRHTKTNKRNKIRKFRGGKIDQEGYTLVGFRHDGSDRPWVPFFLLNNLEYKLDTTDKFPPGKANGTTQTYHLILPQLYKLKIRGLDLNRLLDPFQHNVSQGFILFYDEQGNKVIDENFVPPIQRSNVTLEEWLETRPSEDNPKYKDIIREVELKYPGLFQRMYVTPEEEEEALKEIQEKEQEKQEKQEETLITTKNEEIQEIQKDLQEMKTALQKIQKNINGKKNTKKIQKISDQLNSQSDEVIYPIIEDVN